MPGARATYATVYAASMSLRRLKEAQGPLGRPKAALRTLRPKASLRALGRPKVA